MDRVPLSLSRTMQSGYKTPELLLTAESVEIVGPPCGCPSLLQAGDSAPLSDLPSRRRQQGNLPRREPGMGMSGELWRLLRTGLSPKPRPADRQWERANSAIGQGGEPGVGPAEIRG
ncbi:hypothetical protein VTG60DRAFT_468 [Thermothelomyces hinnuleus]